MLTSLEDKVVVVTGGSGGLGKSVVTKLVQTHKAKVIVLDKNAEQLDALSKEFPAVQVYTCDVSSRENVDAVFASIHSSNAIDILINNAGIYYEAPTVEHTEGMIQKMFAVNTQGPILCSKAVIPYMQKKKSGQIINVVSTAGIDRCPDRGAYAATKAAIASFTDSLAEEMMSYGIKVMGIYPGAMNTNIFSTAGIDTTGANYLMDKDNIADIMLFMLQQPSDVRIEKIVVRKFNPEMKGLAGN